MRLVICEQCKTQFETNSGVKRFCSKRCKLDNDNEKYNLRYAKERMQEKTYSKCEVCGETYLQHQHTYKYCSKNCREKSRSARFKIQYKITKDNKEDVKALCRNCGEEYVVTEGKQIYCSRRCGLRYNQKINPSRVDYNKRRRLRAKENGEYDDSITLDKVREQFNETCAICGMKTTTKDHWFTNKHFVAGDNYPSIDHIFPISKGGTHTWDNIQLAHKRCNLIKRDQISYKTQSGQMKLSV